MPPSPDPAPRRGTPLRISAVTSHSALSTNSLPIIIFLKLAQQSPEGPVGCLPCHALVDSGATISSRSNLSTCLTPEPQPLYVVDGRLIQSGYVTHFCLLKVKLGLTSGTLKLDVTQLATYPVILGIPWLRSANPSIDWRRNVIFLPHEMVELTSVSLALPFVPNTEGPLPQI